MSLVHKHDVTLSNRSNTHITVNRVSEDLGPVLNPLDEREAAGQRKLPAAAMQGDRIPQCNPLQVMGRNKLFFLQLST